jgi:hypothetical protein
MTNTEADEYAARYYVADDAEWYGDNPTHCDTIPDGVQLWPTPVPTPDPWKDPDQ